MYSSVNTIWVLLGAALVFFMQAGFAMCETGFTRAKNSGNILMKNLMDFSIGTPVFWLVGFGLMFGAGALIGVPVFFLLKSSGNLSLAALGMMAVMLPLFFLAMYEKDGQPLEVVAKHFYEAKFKRPKTRPYKTKNYYALLVQQADVEMEVNRIVQNSQKADSEE